MKQMQHLNSVIKLVISPIIMSEFSYLPSVPNAVSEYSVILLFGPNAISERASGYDLKTQQSHTAD